MATTLAVSVGDTVRVHSLTQSQYNGLSGTVRTPLRDGRHQVLLTLADGSTKVFKLRPINFTKTGGTLKG